jgi:hypothetical protein
VAELKNILQNLNKSKIMKNMNVYIIMIAIFLLSSKCEPLKTEAQYRGVSLYKTRGDYFDKVTVGIKKEENRIFRTSDAREKVIITDTDTIPKRRAKLINGYVLNSEADLKYDAFLSLSYKDLLLWQERYNEIALSIDTAWKYMLDQDPYIEFYLAKDNDMFHFEGVLDTSGLNQIIMDGSIEEYFTKLK